ncbi:MAG: hypothetical protein L6R19_24680 [Alphaproteobacteria bacterium]|nr:hypothetical protein [Alphaproteobacteria bacterium]
MSGNLLPAACASLFSSSAAAPSPADAGAPVTTYYPVTTYRTYRVPAYPQVA